MFRQIAAEKCFARAVDLHERAESSDDGHLHSRAMVWLNLASLLKPDITYAWKAACLMKLGEDEKARDELECGLRIVPTDYDCKENLARVLWKMGDRKRSVEIRLELVRENPDNLELRLNYGNCCCLLGQYENAVDCFREILEFDTLGDRARAATYYNLGLSLCKQGRQGVPGKDEEALDAFHKSKHADPTYDYDRRDQLVVEVKERIEDQGKAY